MIAVIDGAAGFRLVLMVTRSNGRPPFSKSHRNGRFSIIELERAWPADLLTSAIPDEVTKSTNYTLPQLVN